MNSTDLHFMPLNETLGIRCAVRKSLDDFENVKVALLRKLGNTLQTH